MGRQHYQPLAKPVTRKPDYRLMARNGVPAAKLLIAQYQHRSADPATCMEYGICFALAILATVAACWAGSVALEAFGL